MPARQQSKMIAGHECKSAGVPASTVAHMLGKTLFDCVHPNVAATTYRFNNVLNFLDNSGTDRLVVVNLLRSLQDIICGEYTLERHADAAEVIDSFPIEILRVKDLPLGSDDVSQANAVLAELAEEGFDWNSPEVYIVSCHVMKFWFDGWCTFTGRPASTLLNQRKHNKVQLGGAVASILPSLRRMTREALENYGSTKAEALQATNRRISYPDEDLYESEGVVETENAKATPDARDGGYNQCVCEEDDTEGAILPGSFETVWRAEELCHGLTDGDPENTPPSKKRMFEEQNEVINCAKRHKADTMFKKSHKREDGS